MRYLLSLSSIPTDVVVVVVSDAVELSCCSSPAQPKTPLASSWKRKAIASAHKSVGRTPHLR